MRNTAFLLISMCITLSTACGDDGGSAPDASGPDVPDSGAGPGPTIDGGNNVASGCKKVDLVFALDGSGSMEEERSAMATEVFPAFATALKQVGGGLEDYRIGVMDACPRPANFHTRGVATDNCNFQSGEVWMTSESTALEAEFSCVGDIYIADHVGGDTCSGNNDDEQPVSAAIAGLTTPYIDGANAGFLRDDALLVVVAITDEDETPTGDVKTAQGIYDQLVAVKGDVKRMVMLGIGGASECNGTYGEAFEASLLKNITQLFIAEERGVFWDLCQGQLEDGLTEAMQVIEQACDEFPPIL